MEKKRRINTAEFLAKEEVDLISRWDIGDCPFVRSF
jgi:hypothetical protein